MEQRLLSGGPKSAIVALSLITNPFTSHQTLSSLLDTLILNLQDQKFDHPNKILSLLATISRQCPQLSSHVISAVLEFIFVPSVPIPSLPHALSLLLDIDHSNTISTDPFCEESLFLSLCFWQCVKTRRWAAKNVGAFHGVRPSVLLTVLIGITKDPYPCIREAALDGLVLLSNRISAADKSLTECCYFRATELLFDAQKSVRCSAVRAVCEWGQLLVSLKQEKCKRDWSDAVFVQLCLMARDMDMNIRVSAFDALGKIQMVSEDLLMQSLSRKALESTKEKNYPGHYTVKLLRIPASAAAFTFVHGLQDEFHEVRQSACRALQMLMAFSSKFTGEAVHVLMDILNDDSLVVRLQALETLHHISLCGQLMVEESHLHMFFGSLMDGSPMIRSASRKAIQSIKLPKLKMFRLCIDALMKNLELYPLDEAEIFCVLYKIGRIHGKYVASIIQEVFQELEPSFDGKLRFHTRTAALLVLAISASVSFDREICSIPPQVFSYAVTMLGRISSSLVDLFDQNTLLNYLSHCSKFTALSASEFFNGELLDSQPKNSNIYHGKMSDRIFDGCSDNLTGLKKVTTPFQHHLNSDDAATSYPQVIFQQVRDLWPMIQLGYMNEVIRTLRNWKHELKRSNNDYHQSTAIFVFSMNYLSVIKLYGKTWTHYLSLGNLQFNGMGVLEALSQKTERRLKEILCRFLGLSREEELHILELTLVTHTLRLSSGATCCFNACMNELRSVISRVEQLHRESSIELSDFIIEVQNALCEIDNSEDDATDRAYLFQKSLYLFSPKHIALSGEIKYMSADVNIFDNSFENPIPFVAGLPVGVSLEITLYNISCEVRLWLTIALTEKPTQFIFLNFHEFEGCNEVRKFPFVAPFYRTPKVKYFSIKISIAIECLSKVQRLRHKNGPKHELIELCREKEVHLSLVQ